MPLFYKQKKNWQLVKENPENSLFFDAAVTLILKREKI